MAEIRVERKRGVGAWVWVLLALIIVAAVVFYCAKNGYIHIPGITTSYNQGAVEWLTNASASVGIRLA